MTWVYPVSRVIGARWGPGYVRTAQRLRRVSCHMSYQDWAADGNHKVRMRRKRLAQSAKTRAGLWFASASSEGSGTPSNTGTQPELIAQCISTAVSPTNQTCGPGAM